MLLGVGIRKRLICYSCSGVYSCCMQARSFCESEISGIRSDISTTVLVSAVGLDASSVDLESAFDEAICVDLFAHTSRCAAVRSFPDAR